MILDCYIIVDWSASNRPRAGKGSIWVYVLDADGRTSTENPRTRGNAEIVVRDALHRFVAAGNRVLVGFDFPYAYPAGLGARLGLTGPPWLAMWQYLVAHLHDDRETNASNRFEVAAAINARLEHTRLSGAGHLRTPSMICLPGGIVWCTGSKGKRPDWLSGGRSKRSSVRAALPAIAVEAIR
jgi:hypothetical protein